MTATFKVLSHLLTYPTGELQAAASQLKAALAEEALVPEPDRSAVCRLIDDMAAADIWSLQERYVFLFDRTRSLSLHLFEHVHGESRDRGQALVDLQDLYRRHGLAIDARELPDFLPLFLEFLSTLPVDEALSLLAEPLHVIASIGERLRRRRSAYAVVFRALEALSRDRPSGEDLSALLTTPDDDADDLEALDRAWEDRPVTFGPGAAGADRCPRAADMLARMDDTVADRAPLSDAQ